MYCLLFEGCGREGLGWWCTRGLSEKSKKRGEEKQKQQTQRVNVFEMSVVTSMFSPAK